MSRKYIPLLIKPECLTALSTFAIFLATATAAVIGIAQWRTLNSTDKAIRIQAGIMQGQLDEMKVDHRPWVGLGSITANPDSSSIVAVKNAGKSPAMNVRVKIFGRADDGKPFSVPTQPCGDDCTFRSIEMLPDVQLSDRVPRTDEPLPQPGTALWLGIKGRL